MVILEFKACGRAEQFASLDEAVRVTQFTRNGALRSWVDNRGASRYGLNKQCAVLAAKHDFAERPSSQVCAKRQPSGHGVSPGLVRRPARA